MKRAYVMKNGFSPGKLLLSGLAIAMALTVSVSTVFAAPAPVILADTQYSQDRLGPNPAGHAWGNVIPNALADYYTFQPLSHADAIALGFTDYLGPDPLIPANTITHSCGNKAITGSPADQSSTNDCYVITVKKFSQALALQGILGGTAGLIGPDGLYFGPANNTTVYGYGSGGHGWTPPQFVFDAAATPAGIRPKNPATDGALVTVQGNAPAPYFNGPPGSVTPATVQEGIWHFPAPSIKGTKGRSVRVQWLNEIPNEVMPGLDPTVDCSDSSPNCFPYNRIVTHVHGAHVGPASDGLTQGEYNPDFSNVGVKFSTTKLDPKYGPPGTYVYPMDQEAATIWYHDHAAGSTHLNTNMGMAGFFPITDANEQALKASNILPTGAYELGFALQDRVFYTTGQLAMPDAPVIDGNFPSCDPATAASRLATCSPLFMYVQHAANTSSITPAGIHKVPYDETTITDFGPGGINENAPYLATSATLEFFGNMPVVNGVVYGKYDVEPTVYRMRFLGGTDSRTWSLHFENRSSPATVIPVYQIGTEQGFLKKPVSVTDVLLMPGERVDLLVDFTGIAAGTKIVLNNLGTDAPYQGEQLTPFNRSTDIPEIMEFNIVAGAGSGVTSPVSTATTLNAYASLSPTLNVPIRRIALEEIVDEYQRIMPTIDRRGYDLPGMPATEIVRVNDTEIWDIINTTADAHPMHLHQVAFQIVHRQPWATFTPAVNDLASGVFSQPNYTAAGPAITPAPGSPDEGWKDTVYSPPGFVTRVIAKFDLIGEYVWHCHILSHEEHDMMRPLKVVASNLNPPASLTVPSSTPNNRSTSVTVAVPTFANSVPVNYIVEYKKTVDPNWTTNLAAGLVQSITFPSDGTYELRAKAVDSAISPTFGDSTYALGSNPIVVAPSDTITSPLNNAVLAGPTQTFLFSSSGVFPHTLWVGSTGPGSSNLARGSSLAGTNSITVSGLPTNGSTVYVRLFVKDTSVIPNVMRYNDFTYVTPNVVPPVAAAPTYIGYSATSSDGVISVTWGASATAGVQYELQESLNGGAYSTIVGMGNLSVTSVTFSGEVDGNHTYRVRAIKTGYTPSAWRTGTTTTVVAKTVKGIANIGYAASSNNGTVTIVWGASATAGAQYELQESVNAGAYTTVQSNIAGTSYTLTGRTNGNYKYQVRATLSGWAPSPWRTGTTTCVVNLLVSAPPSIGYPASSSTGNFSVAWGASSTPGAQYELQESIDGGGYATIQTNIVGTSVNLTGKLAGHNYRYQVRGIIPIAMGTWTPSAWRIGSTVITVP